jgi:hypothetical protein
MKKIILCSCIVFFVTACSKKNDNSNSSNSWTFKGVSYKAANVTYINGGSEANLSASATGATSTNSNGLVFTFMTPPTQSSQMLITSTYDANTVLVSTSNLTGTATTFYSNDITNIKANVTVSGGKISITFPGTIWLHNNSNFNDSAQLSVGTITQQ